MLASRATRLDRDENFWQLPIWIAGNGLLIFRPEPRGNRFLDIGESFLFVLTLGNTSGQRGAFHYKPAIFRFVERYVKNHKDILPAKA